MTCEAEIALKLKELAFLPGPPGSWRKLSLAKDQANIARPDFGCNRTCSLNKAGLQNPKAYTTRSNYPQKCLFISKSTLKTSKKQKKKKRNSPKSPRLLALFRHLSQQLHLPHLQRSQSPERSRELQPIEALDRALHGTQHSLQRRAPLVNAQLHKGLKWILRERSRG